MHLTEQHHVHEDSSPHRWFKARRRHDAGRGRVFIVDVAIFNAEDGGDAHGELPGADIALYLTRHGIKVNVTRQKTRIDIGNSLLSLAADLASDMMVMGGYGHSRFRKILLGGVTRTILGSMTVPVLMSG